MVSCDFRKGLGVTQARVGYLRENPTLSVRLGATAMCVKFRELQRFVAVLQCRGRRHRSPTAVADASAPLL